MKNRSKNRGQAFVEMAIMLPFFVLAFQGIFWFGLRQITEMQMNMAARAAAWSVLYAPEADMNEKANELLEALQGRSAWPISEANVSIQRGSAGSSPGVPSTSGSSDIEGVYTSDEENLATSHEEVIEQADNDEIEKGNAQGYESSGWSNISERTGTELANMILGAATTCTITATMPKPGILGGGDVPITARVSLRAGK